MSHELTFILNPSYALCSYIALASSELMSGIYCTNQAMSCMLHCICFSGTYELTFVLQVILSCVYGSTTTVRLKQQGMEFAVWVFKHAEDAQLRPQAAIILQKLLQLLNQGDAAVYCGL